MYESKSKYETIRTDIVRVKVPKAPQPGVFGPVAWIDPMVMVVEGKTIHVDGHLRNYYVAQAAYDGNMGGLKRERIDAHLNFYVSADMCGKWIVARAELVRKITEGHDRHNMVINYWPIEAEATQEHKFPEKKPKEGDTVLMQIPGTERLVVLRPIPPRPE